jgi:trehalose 6-phosphate synthase
MTTHQRHPVLVASNRGPVSFGFADDGSLTAHRGGGGLVSGLSSALAVLTTRGQSASGAHAPGSPLWICTAMSDADRAAAVHGVVAAGESPGDVPVLMLDIPAATFEAAYNGIANSVLWFVHHMLYDTPNQPLFGAGFRADWAAYTGYNEAFAAALAEHAPDDGGKVIIQDYHLALAPRLLRDRRPDARIAHFSHTPWAPPAYFRMLPDDVGQAVLDGMLGADHLGFLAARWADAFLDCCTELLGARVEPDRSGQNGRVVSYRNRATTVGVHPLGTDVESLRERACQADVRAHMAMLREQAAGRQLIVRVDRTELSKNIVRGLEAYRELLATRPEWREKVTHLAFSYPSRSGLASYRAYTEKVIATAAEINDQFATPRWQPVVLEVKDDYARSLAACSVADVLLINPIRDGMNLVAEEGPILSEHGCALVLSREAGAAALIGEHALLVNPFDVSGTADALHEALSASPAERRRRSALIASAAGRTAPAQWLAAQLEALG